MLGVETEHWVTAGGTFAAAWTSRATGDFRIDGDPDDLAARRAEVGAWLAPAHPGAPLEWVWLRQVHGGDVLVVGRDDLDTVRGTAGDALVTREPGVLLAVQTADCAPVALLGRDTASGDGGVVVGIAHAGWRGIMADVLAHTVASMRALGADTIGALLGPCIHAECYEFGEDELDRVATRFGPTVRATTSWGAAALDVPAAVRAALAELDVSLVEVGGCTACDADRYYSHRARGEIGRLANLVWIEP